MDSKINQYRRFIKRSLTRYEELINRRPKPDQETQVVLDEARDHYLLHTIGWRGTKRIWDTTLYVRIESLEKIVRFGSRARASVSYQYKTINMACQSPKDDFHEPEL